MWCCFQPLRHFVPPPLYFAMQNTPQCCGARQRRSFSISPIVNETTCKAARHGRGGVAEMWEAGLFTFMEYCFWYFWREYTPINCVFDIPPDCFWSFFCVDICLCPVFHKKMGYRGLRCVFGEWNIFFYSRLLLPKEAAWNPGFGSPTWVLT